MSKQLDIEKKREDMIAGILPSIRTCVQDPTGYTPEDCAGDIMAVLDFKGVVIKVDGELPDITEFMIGITSPLEAYKAGQKDAQFTMKEAGCVVAKSLIETI